MEYCSPDRDLGWVMPFSGTSFAITYRCDTMPLYLMEMCVNRVGEEYDQGKACCLNAHLGCRVAFTGAILRLEG